MPSGSAVGCAAVGLWLQAVPANKVNKRIKRNKTENWGSPVFCFME